MVRQKLIVSAAIVLAATAGGMATAATPALAKTGPPVTVVTTDPPPPGGKATFDPGTGRLVVCDQEADSYEAVAQIRFPDAVITAFSGPRCSFDVFRIPPRRDVQLRVCLQGLIGQLRFCSNWKPIIF